MTGEIGHEKLRVYRLALDFVVWLQAVEVKPRRSEAVMDHLDRAADSVVENIANGNSRRSTAERRKYFDVAIGSALECAACLDILGGRRLIAAECRAKGKQLVCSLVNMLHGLRDPARKHVSEEREPYGTPDSEAVRFAHETLDVYQAALAYAIWSGRFLDTAKLTPAEERRLDAVATSLVLNVAEGNGRFAEADRVRFLEFAQTAAMRAAAGLDLLVAKGRLSPAKAEEGKRLLARVVPLLLGLRGSIERKAGEREGRVAKDYDQDDDEESAQAS